MSLVSWNEIFYICVFIGCGVLALRAVSKKVIKKIKMSLFDSRVQRVEELVAKLYSGEENPYYISVRYREENHIEGGQFTYGEIVIRSFAHLLSLTLPVSGEVFYDLGCGAGKAVFCASLCFPFLRAKGVELLSPMFEFCLRSKIRFIQLITDDGYFKKNKVDIEFIRGDLLQVDFSDGNIFFLNATCFCDDDWNKLIAKLSQLPIGVRLIIVTRHLESDVFELIESGAYAMSWGFSSVFVYRKIL